MTTPTPQGISAQLSEGNTSMPALSIAGLHKVFGDAVAVNSIDLTVPQGSFFGVVGPNGAGKTTLLSMAVGLLRPTEGQVKVFGVDVWAEATRAKTLLGVLPDGLALPERLTGRELLTFLGRLRGLDPTTQFVTACFFLLGLLSSLFYLSFTTGRTVTDTSCSLDMGVLLI
jgi:ABC-type multidrug transport system ATPase subunit